MAPTRAPIEGNGNGFLKLRQKMILCFGALFTMIGTTAFTAELWRTFTGLQTEFRWKWLGVAFAIVGAGLVLIQTLNPMRIIEQAYRIWAHQEPGGRRVTDPPHGKGRRPGPVIDALKERYEKPAPDEPTRPGGE